MRGAVLGIGITLKCCPASVGSTNNNIFINTGLCNW